MLHFQLRRSLRATAFGKFPRILDENSSHSFIGMWMHLLYVSLRVSVTCASDTSALFSKLKLCFKVLEFERIKILTGSEVTAQQGVCWQLFQQPLRVFAVALMLPGGPRLVPATLAQWQALSHFAQKTKKKKPKNISRRHLRRPEHGPTALMWPGASLLNGVSGYCCRETWQFHHYDELKVSSEWETSQLRPFISVFTTSTETKEESWKTSAYLWLVQEEAGQ